jgi:hypothetical protein
VAQVWPVGIDRIGSRIYFFFMAINLVCVPIIYILYPETKARSLEDMDGLFGVQPAAEEARYHDADDADVGKTDRSRLTADRVLSDSERRD